jgi:hypothetical protein
MKLKRLNLSAKEQRQLTLRSLNTATREEYSWPSLGNIVALDNQQEGNQLINMSIALNGRMRIQ